MRPDWPLAKVGALRSRGGGCASSSAPLEKGTSGLKPLTPPSQEAQTAEVHHIEHRLVLDLLADEPMQQHQPSLYVRASGHVLLWSIVSVVCYLAVLQS